MAVVLHHRSTMSKARNHHYVPRWHQRGFVECGAKTLKFLDLAPPLHRRPDGSSVPARTLFDSAPGRRFYQTDLYSTVFGFEIDDEIERRLFGEIDRIGAAAVEAFKYPDTERWVRHFSDLFDFLDAQKLRTPKGLDWLRRHYSVLDQNQLMFEMQEVRRMHCTLWAEGIHEIVSAEDAAVKFLVSDHPVTVYNYAVTPADPRCAYPNDPPIAWKASQTLFPLDRDFCLILTNLEYARDPGLDDPCAKRTNAHNFRHTILKTDSFIRTRKLSDLEVAQINLVLKSRAKRFIAAGREEWLFPERTVDADWAALRGTLLPPQDELWQFEGETYVRYEDGHVHYQDALGRSEPRAPFLDKPRDEWPCRPKDLCGCGSGDRFESCCKPLPAELRPSWTQRSIRERNLMFIRGIVNILELSETIDWAAARRNLTDEKIAKIYSCFRVLWPPETDIVGLLPKPDGRLRALYTGLVDPRMLIEYALGASTYFGEILIQNPFLNAATIQTDYNPTDNPAQYRQEVLKCVLLQLELLPLIHAGAVNFFPDPCHFSPFLRRQMMGLAEARQERDRPPPIKDPRLDWMAKDDFRRALWSTSEETQRSLIRRAIPEVEPEMLELMIRTVRENRTEDVLAMLQDEPLESSGGLMSMFNLTPNFEMSLYLAQATGAVIMTDSPYRWTELQRASWVRSGQPEQALPALRAQIEALEHPFFGEPAPIAEIASNPRYRGYRSLFWDALRYLRNVEDKGRKPNWEAQLPKRVIAAHAEQMAAAKLVELGPLMAKIHCLIPSAGMRDNSVNRLLVMSGVEHYRESVPMAFYIESPDPSAYDRAFAW
jgi:hypothetical protein